MSVEAGGLVLRAEPYVHVLAQKERGQRCDFCLNRQTELRRCSSCKLLRYCNITCQKSDWSIHKEECRCLQQVSPRIPMDSVRLLFRLIIRHERGDSTRHVDVDPSWRTFSQFQSHSKEIAGDSKRARTFSEMMFTLNKMAGSIFKLPDTSKIFEMFGKMTINSFSICDGEMQPIGVGIYLSPSLLDHKCQPNAVVTFTGKTLEVRALQALPEVSPNNVYISYIDQLAPSSERRRQLEEQYYFTCDCSRCTDEDLDHLMSSFKCPQGGCSGFVYMDNDSVMSSCNECRSSPESSYVSKLKNIGIYSLEQLSKIDEEKKNGSTENIMEICKGCLSKQEALMGPQNINMVRVLDRAFDAAIDLEIWDQALAYGKRTIEPYLHIYPPGSPNVGVQLMKIGKIQLYLQELGDALVSLHKARSILRLTHGKLHPIYKDLVELLDQCAEEKRHNLQALRMS
ncbi:hypothetical protein ScPMuIL_010219 [Solemya velum]